jgi:pimeloyl-ACP methyl ester carboxylesterase
MLEDMFATLRRRRPPTGTSAGPQQATPDHERPTGWRDAITIVAVVAALIGVAVVLWASLTEWGGIVHGHPAYLVLLCLTLLGCVLFGLLAIRRRARRRSTRRTVGRVVLVVLAIGWIAIIAWPRPHTAEEPALAAMQSDAAVTVSESATEIVLTPTGAQSPTGVFFQPGALVDARAYAAVLRPLAEHGHTVVITKQPLGIAFLALGAFDGAAASHPEVDGWVIAGHSLGGTVAAIEADSADTAGSSPAIGLMFYASYPATDISASLTIPVQSISGTRDGLSTPEKIAASRENLPADSVFTIIDGASHAQFGDYGAQAGDDVPKISHDEARRQISAASLTFVDSLAD